MSPAEVRKQRTRQHVIAAMSVNYLERFILEESHSAHRFAEDYGYDVALLTYDSQGYVEPGLIYFQLKASEQFRPTRQGVPFDLDVRDYHLWIREAMPVVLVLYEASKRKAVWLHVQAYFQNTPSRRPKEGAKTVRVVVPTAQRINRKAVRRLRAIKQDITEQGPRGISHV